MTITGLLVPMGRPVGCATLVVVAAVALILFPSPACAGTPETKEEAAVSSDQPVLLVIQGRLKPGKEEVYGRYIAGTRPLMERYGVDVVGVGEGFASEHTTASWPLNGLLRFPDAEAADKFFADPGYEAIKPLRDEAYEVMNLSFFTNRAARVLGPRQVAEAAFEQLGHGLASGEWQGWFDMLSDDFSFHFPLGRYQGLNRGKENAIEFFNFVSQVYPDGLHVDLKKVTGTGNTVVFEFEDEGLMRGEPYHNLVAISLDVCGDKICGYREYFGLVGPPPAPAAGSNGEEKTDESTQ